MRLNSFPSPAVLIGSVLVLAGLVGFAPRVKADQILRVPDGTTTYQINMGVLHPWVNYDVGGGYYREVDFLISTPGDKYWHGATATCTYFKRFPVFHEGPAYDVNVPDYNWDWQAEDHSPAAEQIAHLVCRPFGQ